MQRFHAKGEEMACSWTEEEKEIDDKFITQGDAIGCPIPTLIGIPLVLKRTAPTRPLIHAHEMINNKATLLTCRREDGLSPEYMTHMVGPCYAYRSDLQDFTN